MPSKSYQYFPDIAGDFLDFTRRFGNSSQGFLHAAGKFCRFGVAPRCELAHSMLRELLLMTTMLARFNDEVTTTIDAVMPPVGQRVIVQCEGFRCVGVCDVNGRWLDIYNHQPLSNVIGFRPLGSRKQSSHRMVHLSSATSMANSG
jgi:hypothetical protein